MKFPTVFANNACKRDRHQKGIALITALLLLALLTGLSIAMFLSVNSDAITNGYYRNFRGSFYAADSGLAVVRQDLKNKIVANIGAATGSVRPIDAGIENAVLASLKSSWASDTDFKSITKGSSVTDSVDARFRIEPGSFTLTGTCFTNSGAICDGATGVTSWNYTYAYSMVAIGQAGTSHQNRIEESGTLTVNVPVGVDIPASWAGYGMYVTNQDLCSGSYFAPGTIYGPVYSGGCFTFGTSGTNSFTDPVACGGSKAGYQFSNTCKQVAGPYATNGSGKSKVTIAPDFQSGLYFSQEAPKLPTDSYNQKRAVLDGIGQTKTDDKTWQDIASGKTAANDSSGAPINPLRDVKGDLYKSNATSGVYASYDNTTKTLTGGGIYVAGNASVSLTTSSTSTQVQQTYTIINNGTTTTVTYTSNKNTSWNSSAPYDPPYTVPGNQTGSGTVTITSGGNSVTLNNVSYSRDESGNFVDNATIIYVNGNVTSLHGLVQDDNALNITALGDITVDADLKYKTKPISTADNEPYTGADGKQHTVPKADSIIPGQNNGQALGLFTAEGNIITTLKNRGNLEVDASLATISAKVDANGNLILDANGNPIPGDGGLVIPNTSAMIDYLTIIGGRVNNALYSTSKLGQRNLYFDRRYGSRLTPPFFPGARPSDYVPPEGATVVRFHRQQWVNQTAY